MSGRNGWLSGALLLGILSVLAWFAPISDQLHSRKGRAFAAAFDTIVQPVIDTVGNGPVAVAFAVAALFMLGRALGITLPRLPVLTLPRLRRERPDADEADEPGVPRQRRRDLSRLAMAEEAASFTQPLPHAGIASESPDPADAEPAPTAPATAPVAAQQTWENPFATERAHVEYLAARHGSDEQPTRDAMLQSYRNLVGPDAELSDEVYEKAAALVREQRRRATPHGQRIDPVALVRKPREKLRDWTGDRSWLGGLPRLGGGAWPRGKDGRPLPFIAQVDLAEIAAANPDTPLPRDGSLAFFIGSGAVVHVPPGAEEITPPPDDLPPAFGEDGHQLPEQHSRVTHRTYPFWPVEPIRLRLPDDLPALPGPDDDDDAWDAFDVIRAAQVEALHAVVPPARSFAANGETVPASDMLWWYGADHVLRQLQECYDHVDAAIASREKWIVDGQAYQARLAAEPSPDSAKIAASKESEARHRDAIPAIRRQGENLGEFIAHVAGFVAGREPWIEMTAEEIAVLQEVLDAAREQFPDLCSRVPRRVEALHDICVRRMITGDAAAVAALPDDLLEYRNSRRRLADENQHQMFGLGGSQQGALYDHLSDHLLLQLGPDAEAELLFGDMGIWQFWISPEDLAAGRWDRASLTFEMG